MEIIQQPKGGDSFDATQTMYPSSLQAVCGTREFREGTDTVYGVIVSGSARLACDSLKVEAKSGAYFCFPGALRIEASGLVVVIARMGFRGILSIGRFESTGRLTYIDGCSSTVLVVPPRLGDPVLNHLHFPPETLQTEHVHPSIRFGVVVKGKGIAFGSNPSKGGRWEKPLTEGSAFFLHAQERHAFQTLGSPEGMDIISYHPESDWGPTDQSHPMLTRTYLSK